MKDKTVTAIEHRLARLRETLEIIEKEKGLDYIKADTETRIDELESLLEYITGV